MCKKTVRLSLLILMFIVVGTFVLPKPMVCDAKSKLKFTHTKGKNKSDVKALKKIIRNNLRKDCDIVELYTDFDSGKYQWNARGRLVRMEADEDLKGNVSFSKLKKLKHLSVGNANDGEDDCRGRGRIKKLDIKGCTSLEYLDCSDNRLRSLEVLSNTALITLKCDVNRLSKLDISACKLLETLRCVVNNLENLNIKGNAALKRLYCQYNCLADLDVSSCTELEEFHCFNNHITSLNITNNKKIQEFKCDDVVAIIR